MSNQIHKLTEIDGVTTVSVCGANKTKTLVHQTNTKPHFQPLCLELQRLRRVHCLLATNGALSNSSAERTLLYYRE